MTKEYEGMDLTAEELAALAAPDDEDQHATQEQLEALAAAEGGAQAATTTTTTTDEAKDDPTTTPAADGADTGAAAAVDAVAAAAAADVKPDAAAGTPAPAESGSAPSAAPQQAPILVAKAPDDAKVKLEQIATDKAALRQKYDDGDITFAEYEADKEKLDEQRMDIRLAVEKAETAAQMEVQQKQNQWNADCASFIAQHAAIYDPAGVTDQAAKDAALATFNDLDAAVKAIAVMPSSASLTGPQILERAHRAVMAARGTPVVAAPPAAQAAKPAVPKPTLPPDLGKMPSAGVMDTGEGKWASLDRLQDSNPEAYEAALSKLSDSERDSYLAA